MDYTDVTPTFLAVAGLDPLVTDTGCPDANGARGFDGMSFLDVLSGKSDNMHDHVFAQHTTVGVHGYKKPCPMRSARDSRYNCVRNQQPRRKSLAAKMDA